MASVTVSNNPSTTGNTLTVNFTTDATNITGVQLTSDGTNYISATSFTSSSATFDVSTWNNGTYSNCKLKVIYTETIVSNNFTITYNLTNCISSNNANSAKEGNSYSTVISANTNYEMNSISVTMGESDITSSAVSGNNISISNVTGNIAITATATAIVVPSTYTITNNLSNCTSSNSSTSINKGSSYSATITANSNYTISNITVTMGGANVTSSAVNGNNINISNVTGNIVITATATVITRTITYNLNNCISSNTNSSISNGSSYSTTITANANYEISSIAVTMGGANITSSAVNRNAITISSVTGNIVITATATEISSGGGATNLLPPLTQWTKSDEITVVNCTGDYSATITSSASWGNLSATVSNLAKGDNITFSCSSISPNITISISDILGEEIASLSSSKLSATVDIKNNTSYEVYIYMSGESNGTINDISLIKNN